MSSTLRLSHYQNVDPTTRRDLLHPEDQILVNSRDVSYHHFGSAAHKSRQVFFLYNSNLQIPQPPQKHQPAYDDPSGFGLPGRCHYPIHSENDVKQNSAG